jgi:hypothetical protein
MATQPESELINLVEQHRTILAERHAYLTRVIAHPAEGVDVDAKRKELAATVAEIKKAYETSKD